MLVVREKTRVLGGLAFVLESRMATDQMCLLRKTEFPCLERTASVVRLRLPLDRTVNQAARLLGGAPLF